MCINVFLILVGGKNEMGELISVIIPVYNVEKYLKRCIDSIINQTYRNLEIILIDDGSNDNSSNICDEYQNRDNRIIVIHKKNGGLSSARNQGMLAVKGDYVCFVDSDDWIDSNFIEYLYCAMKENNSQIVECLFKKTTCNNLNQSKLKYTDIKNKNFFGDECFIEFIKGNIFKQTVWNKLYSFKLIQNISFEEGRLHEDEFWTYQVFAKAKRVTYLNYIGYYYFQRDESIMGSAFSEKNMDGFDARCRRLNYVRDNYANVYQSELFNFLISCIYFYTRIYENNFPSKQKYLMLVKEKYRKAFKLLNFEELTLKKKIWLISFFLIPNIYCCINKKFHFV
jgi:glycosyltransferase involved in cell wall biosynthesis